MQIRGKGLVHRRNLFHMKAARYVFSRMRLIIFVYLFLVFFLIKTAYNHFFYFFPYFPVQIHPKINETKIQQFFENFPKKQKWQYAVFTRKNRENLHSLLQNSLTRTLMGIRPFMMDLYVLKETLTL